MPVEPVPTHAPLVSALITAFNRERFVGAAVESVLAQEGDGFELEVIVVDDGSTDATAAVVERYVEAEPERVRLLRQPNGGYVSACNAAMAAARGDLYALLDADDAWPAGKTRAQVELLRERPQVGLVYGDMCVIDAEGRVIQESWLEGDDPPSGRCYGALLTANPATSSSIMLRADLAARIGPIPADLPYADWWLTLRAAQLAEIAYLAEPRTLYRFHGANMSLGVEGEPRTRELRKTVDFQRMLLRQTTLDHASPRQLGAAWASLERFAEEALRASATPFAEVATVTDDDRADARRLVERAHAAAEAGDPEAALVDYLHAAAADPWCGAARAGLQGTLFAAATRHRQAAA